MSESFGSSRALGPRSIALIVIYGGALLFALAASGKTLNYHEARYAQAAREMVESGHWLIPTVGGDPRLQKPAFTYWVIAIVFKVFGANDFTSRLPTALAALATALIVAALAARRLGEKVGVVAGLVQTSSVYTLVSGQLADPDMLLAAAVAAAITCFAAVILPDPGGAARSRWRSLGFFTALGVSFLVKGPIGAAFILPPCLVLAVFVRGRQAWRPFVDPLGSAVLVALMAIWPIAAYLSNGAVLAAWLEENVGRLRGDLGRDPALYYVYTVPWMLLPWAPFTFVGALAVWRDRQRAPLWVLLATWFASSVLILSLSAGKHARYLVPVLPALSAFTAVGLRQVEPWIAKRMDPVRAFAAALAALLIGTLATQAVAERYFDGYRHNRELAERASCELPADTRLTLIGIPNNERVQLLFYLSRLPSVAMKVEDLSASLPMGSSYVIAPAEAMDALRQVGSVSMIDEAAKPLRHHTHEERLVLMKVERR